MDGPDAVAALPAPANPKATPKVAPHPKATSGPPPAPDVGITERLSAMVAIQAQTIETLQARTAEVEGRLLALEVHVANTTPEPTAPQANGTEGVVVAVADPPSVIGQVLRPPGM